jgi:Protein of unknown function (DUF2934)
MEQSLEVRIRERAYEIWSAHGRPDGRADAYWLTAEREIQTVPHRQKQQRRAHAFDSAAHPFISTVHAAVWPCRQRACDRPINADSVRKPVHSGRPVTKATTPAITLQG